MDGFLRAHSRELRPPGCIAQWNCIVKLVGHGAKWESVPSRIVGKVSCPEGLLPSPHVMLKLVACQNSRTPAIHPFHPPFLCFTANASLQRKSHEQPKLRRCKFTVFRLNNPTMEDIYKQTSLCIELSHSIPQPKYTLQQRRSKEGRKCLPADASRHGCLGMPAWPFCVAKAAVRRFAR